MVRPQDLYREYCISRGKTDCAKQCAATPLDLVQNVSSEFRSLATVRHHQERLSCPPRTCSGPTNVGPNRRATRRMGWACMKRARTCNLGRHSWPQKASLAWACASVCADAWFDGSGHQAGRSWALGEMWECRSVKETPSNSVLSPRPGLLWRLQTKPTLLHSRSRSAPQALPAN